MHIIGKREKRGQIMEHFMTEKKERRRLEKDGEAARKRKMKRKVDSLHCFAFLAPDNDSFLI